jgi:hypothetical protein
VTSHFIASNEIIFRPVFHRLGVGTWA